MEKRIDMMKRKKEIKRENLIKLLSQMNKVIINKNQAFGKSYLYRYVENDKVYSIYHYISATNMKVYHITIYDIIANNDIRITSDKEYFENNLPKKYLKIIKIFNNYK